MIRELLGGAARGTVATAVMSIPILAAPDLIMGRRPPKQVTVAMLAKLGLDPDEEDERNVASTLAHLGFGASMGSLFSVARARLHPPGPAVLHGLAYGLGIWAVSYNGWIPALGLLPQPERDRPGRQSVMLAAHLVYGGVLGALDR